MRLSEQSLKLLSVFKEASRNFIIVFSLTRLGNKLKTICADSECTDLIFKALKKYPSIYLKKVSDFPVLSRDVTNQTSRHPAGDGEKG